MLITLGSGSGSSLALLVGRVFPIVVVVLPVLTIIYRHYGCFLLRSWRRCWVGGVVIFRGGAHTGSHMNCRGRARMAYSCMW